MLLNGISLIAPFALPGYSSKDTTVQLARAKLVGNVQFDFLNNSLTSFDQYMIGQIEISYSRTFDFSNQSVFEFSLDASVSDKLIEIASFRTGTNPPVLLDLTNNHRIIAETVAGNRDSFFLQMLKKKFCTLEFFQCGSKNSKRIVSAEICEL